MPDSAGHRAGFSVTEGREAKARKICAVLDAAKRPLACGDMVLDVGTGSGGIAAALGSRAAVFATDSIDQRFEKVGFAFVLADERLPFAEDTFDVVVSNHVIEHVGDPYRHIAEIRRVLKPSGLCYLATPNRWWPIEAHSRLAFIHWLPPRLFNRIAMGLAVNAEPVQLQSLMTLRRLSKGLFDVETWHDRIIHDPAQFAVSLPPWALTALKLLPEQAIRCSLGLHPTLIALLRPIQ